jgi:hypothetical protein
VGAGIKLYAWVLCVRGSLKFSSGTRKRGAGLPFGMGLHGECQGTDARRLFPDFLAAVDGKQRLCGVRGQDEFHRPLAAGCVFLMVTLPWETF